MSGKEIDPATLAVIWNGLISVSKEMSTVIVRTCRNYITVQLNDHFSGIFDANGRLIASHAALPTLGGVAGLQIKDVIKTYGDEIYPGDRFVMNCPYTAHGTHLPDWSFIKPIFYEGKLAFWAFVKTHQMDSSGSFPGGYFPNAYDIHAEGLAIPPTKLYERGQLRKDLYALLLNNIRYREDQSLDHQAMFAALDVAERRVQTYLDKYGREVLDWYVDETIQRMRLAVSREIEQLPDGVYHGEASVDDDGTTHDRPVAVRCEIRVQGEKITVDWSKSDGQVNFINSPPGNTYTYSCNAVFATLSDPDLSPYHNEGSYQCIQVELGPKRSVTNPEYPATVGACPVNVGHQLLEAVFMAISQADPTRASAGWSKQMAFDDFGVDRRGSKYYVAHFNANGGSGGIWGHDGWPNLASVGSLGCQLKANIEMTETRFPFRVNKHMMRTDSEGAGRWRGGPGTHVEWMSVCEGNEHAFVTGNSDGMFVGHHPVAGGGVAPRNQQYLVRADTGEKTMIPTKRGPFFFKHGDILIQMSGGGAGVGNPKERDPEKVRWDVLNQLISIERAREVYGVAINPITFQIDVEATQKLRS